MKCESCGTLVDKKFTFALKNNQCPACGSPIMSPERLSSFQSLKELLNNGFKGVDVEGISSLIIANFDLKQRFKETILSKTEEKDESTESSEQKVPDKDDIVVEEQEDDGKPKVMPGAKDMLQKLRQQALQGGDFEDDESDADEWGLGNANSMVTKDDVERMMLNQKRNKSKEAFATGSGAFSRSE